MKHLTGAGEAVSGAPLERCLALVSDVAGYPRWYGQVMRSAVPLPPVAGEAAVPRFEALLAVAIGPLRRELGLELELHHGDGRTVRLRRVPSDRSDRETFSITWTVEPAGTGTRLAVTLDAQVDVPSLVPVGGVAASFASGLAEAAAGELGGG